MIRSCEEERLKFLKRLQALEEWYQRGQRERCDPPQDVDRRLAGWFWLLHQVTFAPVNWGPLAKPPPDPDP